MLAQLVFLLPAVGALLSVLGFKRTLDRLGKTATLPQARKPLDGASVAESARRTARLVDIAANHGPYRATCLRRSLALWWLLRRRGIPAELRIGVRKDGKDLSAHAWVEHRDAPLGQENLGYSPVTGPGFGNPV